MAHSTTKCAVCKKPGKVCSGCKNISYCSRTCQKADWHIHRSVCSTFKDFVERPIPTAIRAIYFPPHERDPKFVWLKPGWQGPNGFPDYAGFLHSDGTSLTDPHSLPHPKLDDRRREFWFVVRSGCFLLGPNHSMLAITEGQTNHPAQGPALAVVGGMPGDLSDSEDDYDTDGTDSSKSGPNSEPEPFSRDLDTTDFRVIVEALREYGRVMHLIEGHGPMDLNQCLYRRAKDTATVQAIRINCEGEVDILKRLAFEPVQILPSHPIFEEGKIVELGEKIGLPLLAIKDATSDLTEGYTNNPVATSLQLLSDVQDTEIRSAAHQYWYSKTGNVLVIRRDMKPLALEELKILCAWVKEIIQPLFAFAEDHSTHRGIHNRSDEAEMFRKQMYAVISKDNFDAFKKHCQNQLVLGEQDKVFEHGGEKQREDGSSSVLNSRVEENSEEGSMMDLS